MERVPMFRPSAAVVMTLALVVEVPATLLSQTHPHKWWQDEATMTALGMTAQQSADVEAIFQASRPRLSELKKTLDVLEAGLSAMVRERRDEAVVAAKLDEVEDARSALNKARTLMLYRMHRVLSPEQDEQLKELFEKRERERRGRADRRQSP
jgi:Spy/CpxP family protein refolding chaperone